MDYVITGGPRAKNALKEFFRNINNLERLGPEVDSYLARWQSSVFRSEGEDAGQSWPHYTGSERLYGIIKNVLLGGRNLGLLRWAPGQERLLPSLVDTGHPEHVFRVQDGTFVFGTRVPYARDHQEGRGRGPWWAGFGQVKQRKFLHLTRYQIAELRRMFSKFVGI